MAIATTRDGAKPRTQLLNVEALGEIVIRPGVETEHAVRRPVARSQYEDRHRAAECAQPAQDLEPAEARQSEIKNHRVEGFGFEHGHRASALAHDLGTMRLERERVANGVRN